MTYKLHLHGLKNVRRAVGRTPCIYTAVLSTCKDLLLILSGTPQLRHPFSLAFNCPCSGDGDKYASWEDVDTTNIQYLSLDRADTSHVVTVNDASLGDMLNGGTSQAQYQATKAWRHVK